MRLQTKVLSVLIPLTLVSGAVILLFSKGAIDTILVEGVAQRGFLELADIAPKVNNGMQAKSEKMLLPFLNTAKEHTQAAYAVALDPAGVVVAHTNILEKGKVYGDPVTRQTLGRDKPGFQMVDARGELMVDVAAPIWAPDEDFLLSHEKGGKIRLGTLRLGLPLGEALATRAKIISRIAFILMITGAIMVIALLLFLREMLLPVRLLAATTHKISKGQYGVTVPISSKDELGELARNFNQMSKDLGMTTVSKDYLDGVIQSIADILIVTDSQGNIRTINHAALKIFGYSERELLGRPVLDLFDEQKADKARGKSHARIDPRLENLVRTGFARDIELDISTKTGERVQVLLSGSALKDRDRKSEGLVIVAKDLTERKKFESMMIQSEKLSAVGQLAAGVAHEINNPLGIILGFAQSVMKRIQAPDPLVLPIKSIEREAMRCKNLVQNLLTFSRQNKPRMEEVDLNEVVTSTLSIIEAQARVKSVEVHRELGDLEPILGDKNQLQQVIVNLCNNAIDAMPNGGKITVRTRKNAGVTARRTVLEIEDTGSGIPKDIQDKIFNPFFTTKEVGKGTGLGLSLVFDIIQRHRGIIEVESEVGRGTTFTILFPAKDSIKREMNLNENRM